MAMSTEPDKNLRNAEHFIRRAASCGADIIALPELFRSPYFCIEEQCARDYAEPVPGVVGNTLSALSRELGVTIVAGSIYEQSSDKKYNTAMAFGPEGTLLGCYRKTHIPHDPAFFEQHYFQSGGNNYQVFTTTVRGEQVRFSILICYDQWFPEAARTVALMGAEIIFYPTAIGTVNGVEESEGHWQHAWRTVQMGHSVANATVVAAINRVGTEHNSVFWGGSFVSDAFGRLRAEGSNQEEIIIASVDLNHNEKVKEGWRFFKERRPDTYQLLTEPVGTK
jgi:agmatine deiminase